jgi:hypothetical protein
MKISILDDYFDTVRTLACFQKLKDGAMNPAGRVRCNMRAK